MAVEGAVHENQTLWPDPAQRPAPVPGQTPEAYRSEHYQLPEDAPSGPGTRRRGESAETGHKRDLSFPEAPQPLPLPIVDNHTHIDIQDGRVHIGIPDVLDVAQDLGITLDLEHWWRRAHDKGIVQRTDLVPMGLRSEEHTSELQSH